MAQEAQGLSDRLTGAAETLRVRPDMPLEAVERFRDEIGNLDKRWHNRLVLERTSLAKAYIDGRIEILLYGDWVGANDKLKFACRISPDPAIHQSSPSASHVDIRDICDSDSRNEQIVLVVVVQDVEGPQRLVRSILRPYLIENKSLGVGQGLLYRVEKGFGSGVYEVFPALIHGKMDLGLGIDGTCDRGGQVVQCAPEIVERVTHDERQRFRDWVTRTVDEAISGRLCVTGREVRLHGNFIEPPMQGRCVVPQLINVAVGPLNL